MCARVPPAHVDVVDIFTASLAMSVDLRSERATVTGVGAPGLTASDPGGVMLDARKRFASTFTAECDTIAALAEGPFTDPAAIDKVTKLLHRMAGLGGTVGFAGVSAKAGELEDALRMSSITPAQLRDAIATLRTLFEQDLAAPPATAATPKVDGASLKVLLVEDEPIQRAITAAHLRKAGHQAVEVQSGDQAVSMARA